MNNIRTIYKIINNKLFLSAVIQQMHTRVRIIDQITNYFYHQIIPDENK